MPNAKDSHAKVAHKILILGKTGSGKTTQFLTLPGKKFIYLFDPNAILTLQGHDVDYEEFLPDALDLGLTSLSSKVKGDVKDGKKGAELYRRWEDDFETKLKSGFFDQYDAIGMDSFTTLSDMVMDGVLAINGRGGQWPQMDDYGPQMLALTKICRTFASIGKTVYFTGHVELRQDDLTKRIVYQPLMTGRLKEKLPLLFSEILLCEASVDNKGNSMYQLKTKPDRQFDIIRCSVRGLEQYEDVTIKDWSKPEDYGLGQMLKRREK